MLKLKNWTNERGIQDQNPGMVLRSSVKSLDKTGGIDYCLLPIEGDQL